MSALAATSPAEDLAFALQRRVREPGPPPLVEASVVERLRAQIGFIAADVDEEEHLHAVLRLLAFGRRP